MKRLPYAGTLQAGQSTNSLIVGARKLVRAIVPFGAIALVLRSPARIGPGARQAYGLQPSRLGPVSNTDRDSSAPHFPTVEARSLDGRRLILPDDLDAGRNLLAVAFQRRHQSDVDTWLDEFESLKKDHEDLFTGEVPTLSRRWAPVRRFIDGGMAAAIPDPRTRATTMTVYGDVSRVSDSLGLPDRGKIAVLLCDREGRVAWLHRGPRSDEAASGLRAALARG